MAQSKKRQTGGFPAKIKGGFKRGVQFLLRLWTGLLRTLSRLPKFLKNIKSKRQARKHIKNMTVKKPGLSQAEAFVASRDPKLQYAIDVLALAFVLAIIFTILVHFTK